jgi:hypothetical protein
MFKVTTVAVDALLKILQRSHPHLPSTSRTLMKSQSNRSGIVAINSGQYCHFGLLNGLLQFKDQLLKSDASVIYYQVNIDGLPLYKSSSVQLWPILGKLLNSTCPFLIDIFCESGKPTNIDEFLCSFVNESKLLAEEGLTIENRKFLAKVACFICDAPARAFIKQIKSHTGYYSCERCMQKGDFCNGRLTFLELDSEKRLDDDFSAMKYKKHQTGTSPLLKLNVGLVSGCILDSMHLLHLGVVRRLILYRMKGPKSCKLSSRHIGMIADKMQQIRSFIPLEFSRKPRSLIEVDRWKASEFRQFILYTGILVLKPVIDKKLYKHFLYLFVAVYTLSSPRLCLKYTDCAKELLELFVTGCVEMYGPQFVV